MQMELFAISLNGFVVQKNHLKVFNYFIGISIVVFIVSSPSSLYRMSANVGG